jgi:hypothetical protein
MKAERMFDGKVLEKRSRPVGRKLAEMLCEEIINYTFHLILLRQCSQEKVTCVIRLVGLHGKAEINNNNNNNNNNNCFAGNAKRQEPVERSQYSS